MHAMNLTVYFKNEPDEEMLNNPEAVAQAAIERLDVIAFITGEPYSFLSVGSREGGGSAYLAQEYFDALPPM